MTANIGRTSTLNWGVAGDPPAGVPVACIREKGLALSGEAVDITNDDSSRWRTLLDAAQVNAADLTFSGVLINDRLRQDWITSATTPGSRLKTAEFVYPLETGEATPASISGEFYLQEYSETRNHDGEITFEVTLMSSGPITYTPGA